MTTATPRRLSEEEVSRQIAPLHGVRRVDDHLVLAATAPSFEEAIRLVNLVAQDAEAMNHHPDIDIRWCTVTFTLSTHSAGGLTQFDIELAHQILGCVEAVGAHVIAT